jgi:DNA-binding MarR family transcriptional regulator
MFSRKNISAILDRLETAGLVQRIRRSADGRLRHVTLTSRGESVWEDMLVSIHGYYRDALADFSTEECVLLFRLLDRLKDSLGQLGTSSED